MKKMIKETILLYEEKSEESGNQSTYRIYIQNFNNSFAQYGQFVDLTSLNRANPQFY